MICLPSDSLTFYLYGPAALVFLLQARLIPAARTSGWLCLPLRTLLLKSQSQGKRHLLKEVFLPHPCRICHRFYLSSDFVFSPSFPDSFPPPLLLPLLFHLFSLFSSLFIYNRPDIAHTGLAYRRCLLPKSFYVPHS